MRYFTLGLLGLLLLVGCERGVEGGGDAGAIDTATLDDAATQDDASELHDACACQDPWQCEWPESGMHVLPGDCIYCRQDDAGDYTCMNLPAGPTG